MKKINILWIILDSIFLIVFNIVFFMASGTEHKASVWISYGFIHLAYLLLILTPFLIRKSKSQAVFGFSIYAISAVYFFIELVTGIILIFISPASYTIALSIQLCIAALYGIILIYDLIANEQTADAEEKQQYQISYIKNASAKLKSLLINVSDKEVKRNIERVYDAVYSSPFKSHPDMEEMENRILISINELEEAVTAGHMESCISLANSLLVIVNKRNLQLKTLQIT